jgi:ABC-type uncharacterized transport system fused permease/ATPase subunit
MEKINLIIAIYCFLGCFWWVLAKLSGKLIFQIIGKLFGITGTILSFIYILKYFSLL